MGFLGVMTKDWEVLWFPHLSLLYQRNSEPALSISFSRELWRSYGMHPKDVFFSSPLHVLEPKNSDLHDSFPFSVLSQHFVISQHWHCGQARHKAQPSPHIIPSQMMNFIFKSSFSWRYDLSLPEINGIAKHLCLIMSSLQWHCWH